MKLIGQLSILLLLCLPNLVLAKLPDQLKQDFAPVSGVIIMPIGKEYLVDLDASSNLQEGDILTLVTPGEKIIHPVTKEVLGTLDVAKGYLQVTRIKSGYSYAKLLSADITPAKGEQVKRFEQVPARFESSRPDTPLAEELKNGLPQLDWLKPTDSTAPELIFSLAGNQLVVKDRSGATLKSYQYADGIVSAPATPHQASPFSLPGTPEKDKSVLNQAVGNLLGSVGFGGKDKRLEAPGIISSQLQTAGIWMGSNLNGNPVGMIVDDFDNDGQLETAVALEHTLVITRINQGMMNQLASVDFPAGTQLLSIDSIDLDKNGFPEIYLTAASGVNLSSQVVEFRNGGYHRIQGELEWFLRVVELPGEGKTLIAQAMGGVEKPLVGKLFRVIRSGGALKKGADLDIPEKINLFSFVPFTGTNNELLYAYVSTGDDLVVTNSQGAQLWKSDERFGGTEVSFNNTKDASNELATPGYILQRLLNLPSGEILVAQNSGVRFLQRFRNFSKSRVVAMIWNGFALQESWRTSEQSGYLADFALADADNDGQDELVMAVKFQQKNILQKGRSTIVIYELNQQ